MAIQRTVATSDLSTLGLLRRQMIRELNGFDSAALEADRLLEGCTGHDRAWIHCHAPDLVSTELCQQAMAMCARRKQHEPLQYILGRCDFCGRSFVVNEGCLVPRPETELLVDVAADHFTGGTFLDWGTGTGCIAIALLDRLTNLRTHALMAEKNPKSLDCARRNLELAGYADRAELLSTRCAEDLYGRIAPHSVSMIVSNPPYIPSSEIDALMPEVSRYEPRLALDGGADGLEPYRWLFALAEKILTSDGFVCVEFGGRHQTAALRAIAPGNFREIGVFLDIAGQDRVFLWQNISCFE